MTFFYPLLASCSGLFSAERPACDPPVREIAGQTVLVVDESTLEQATCARKVDAELWLDVEGPVELPNLEVVTGAININDRVVSVHFPNLRKAGEIGAMNAESLETVSVPSLTSTEAVHFSECPELRELALPRLREVGLSFEVSECPRLLSLDVSRLAKVGHRLAVGGNGFEVSCATPLFERVEFAIPLPVHEAEGVDCRSRERSPSQAEPHGQ